MPSSFTVVRAALGLGASAALLAGAASVAAAATPSGQPKAECSVVPWGDRDKSGEGHGRSTVGIHSGPYDACSTLYTTSASSLLYYHCYTVNDYGNTWSHVRIAGTSKQGWVYDGNLNDNGSTVPCLGP